MIVNFTAIVKDLHGQPIPLNGNPATLGQICAAALFVEPSYKLQPQAKYFRYKLAKDCLRQSTVEIDTSVTTVLMDAIGEAFPISVMGPAWDCLLGDVNDVSTPNVKDASDGVIMLRANA